MDILVIDGVALPTPNEYKVQLSDLDSSGIGRTEDGILVRERVRGGRGENQRQLGPHWSTADCAQGAERPPPRTVCRWPTFLAGRAPAKMYAGDRTADLKAAREGRAVWEVAVNLIEY